MLNLCCFHEGHTLIGLVMRFIFSFEELSHSVKDSICLFFVTIFAMITHQCCFREYRSMRLDF